MYGALGTAMLVVYGVAIGRAGVILAPLHADAYTLFWFFGVMVVGLSIFAQFAQSYALRFVSVATMSVVGLYGSLLVGAVASLAILHETISAWGALAGGLLAVALGLAIAPRREAQRTAVYERTSAHVPSSLTAK